MTGGPTLAYSHFAKPETNEGRVITEPWATFAGRMLAHEAVGYDADPGPAGWQHERHGSLYCAATFEGTRSRANMRTRAFAVLDIETSKATGEVPPPPQEIVGRLRELNIAGVVATSWRHTEANPRYRVVVPLAEPTRMSSAAEVIEDSLLSWGLSVLLGLDGVLDSTKTSAESIFFWPRHAPGAPYFAEAVEGAALTSTQVEELRERGRDRENAEVLYQAASSAHAQQDREQMRGERQEGRSVIARYNESHTLEDLFAKYGYRRNGRTVHWMSPHQTSGSFATRAYPDGRWVSLSASDIAAGVGRRAPSGSACSGDCFDLYRHFEHNNDQDAAIRAAAEELGIDYRSQRERGQRERSQGRQNSGDGWDTEPDGSPSDGPDEGGEQATRESWENVGPLTELDPSAIPARQWLMDGLLMRGIVTGIVAPGGGSKSSFLTAVALSLASGRNLAGAKLVENEPIKVLLYNAEDSLDEMKRKVAALLQQHRISFAALSDRLILVSGLDHGKIIVASRNGDGISTNVIRVVGCMMTREVGAALFDPFVDTHAGIGENFNEEIKAVIGAFARIAHLTNAGVMVAHHTGKQGQGGQMAAGDARMARGASAFIDGVRIAQTLTPMIEDEASSFRLLAKEASLHVRRDTAKNNLQPPAGEALGWLRRHGVEIGNGDLVVALAPVDLGRPQPEISPEMAEVILKEIEKRWGEGLPFKRADTQGTGLAAWTARKLSGGRRVSKKRKNEAADLVAAWEFHGVIAFERMSTRVYGWRVLRRPDRVV